MVTVSPMRCGPRTSRPSPIQPFSDGENATEVTTP